MTPRELLEVQARMGHLASARVLEHGREAHATPAPPGLHRGRIGECFLNAGRLASPGGRWIYCEGWATCHGLPIPVEHAWVLDGETGLFVDVTWPELGGLYFGIPFDPIFVLKTVLRRGYWGLLSPMAVDLGDPAEFLFTSAAGAAIRAASAGSKARGEETLMKTKTTAKIHLIPRSTRYSICGARPRDGGRQSVATRREFNKLPPGERCGRCGLIVNGLRREATT